MKTVTTYNQVTNADLQDFEYVWESGAPNVQEIFDHLDPTHTQRFFYDAAGRLESLQASYGARVFAYADAGQYNGDNIVSMSDGTNTFYRQYASQKLMSEVFR